MFAISVVFFALFLQIGIATSSADSMTSLVQESLIEKGFDPGPVDGVWGARTKSALMQFQESAGLTVSGEIDGPTKSSLLSGASAPASSASAVSEGDTGPDAPDGDIAWGHHKN